MLGRHTPLAPLKRGDWGAAFFLIENEFFESCVSPLERGVLDTVFLLVMRGLMVCRIPLLRGDKGVCYDEQHGIGGNVAGSCVWC